MDWSASRAAIRTRPGMYVGDPHDGSGLVHLALEVLGNAADQYLLGHCRRIDVRLDPDGTVTIEDDGRGFDPDGPGSLLRALTVFHRTATADGHRPHVHLGNIGAGMAVVNALSERLEVTTARDGVMTTVRCARGEVIEPPVSGPTDRPSGTRVRFRADRDIFGPASPPRTLLARELETLTFLTPGLVLSWSLAGEGEADADLAALVGLDCGRPLGGIAHHRATYDAAGAPIQVEVAVGWSAYRRERRVVHSFANYKRTRGGAHVDGLLDGVAATFPSLRRQLLRDGMVAAVSVVLADVTYGNPTKDRLVSPAVRQPVIDATHAALAAWSAAYPGAAATLRERGRRDG